MVSPIKSAAWLIENIDHASLTVIDGSWRMPGDGMAIDDFRERHIPGARFFDINAIADQSSTLPHMLPSPAQFAQAVGEMGISNDSLVVVYDDVGLFSAPRVWWTFRAMGHKNAFVLDGGLPAWQRAAGTLEAGVSVPTPAHYSSPNNVRGVATHADIRQAIDDEKSEILDARPADRFTGESSEPRSGLRSGAMPSARSMPASSLLDTDSKLLPRAEIEYLFRNKKINETADIYATCGSGVTAAMICLAACEIGLPMPKLYDGSWTEWGDVKNDPDQFPVIRQ